MSQDLYEVLEIPENANDIWVRRAYDLKRKAIEGDASLPAEKKQLMLIAVEKAFNTLSNPAARERYDNRHAPKAKASSSGGISMPQLPSWAWVAASALILVAVGMYWQHSRATEKLRIDRERLAAEQAAKMRELALKESGLNEAARLVGAVIENEDAERRASREEREKRSQDYQRQRQEAMARAEQNMATSAAVSAQYSQQNSAHSQRMQEETQRRQAQAEVDRQKRWLDQKEREEQRVMDRQAATARADAARAEAEERRAREAEQRRSRYGR